MCHPMITPCNKVDNPKLSDVDGAARVRAAVGIIADAGRIVQEAA
jgi:hypothetical protein